jgi:hypothetical protein
MVMAGDPLLSQIYRFSQGGSQVYASGRCEEIDFKICSGLGVKKIALGCTISDRWAVGKHLGSKIKSRKLKEIDFFTSS